MQYSLNEKHVDEVGYNYVVVGGFEDRPEHLNKEDYFRVYLNDSENTYFATSEQIKETRADMNEILDPVSEVSHSGYMVDYPRWTFKDAHGELVEAMADMMDIHQVLFEHGGVYIRAARYVFVNLQYRNPRQEWVHFSIKNASEIIDPLGEHGAYTQVYVVEDEFTSRRTAKRAMRREDNFNFENVSRELFAKK